MNESSLSNTDTQIVLLLGLVLLFVLVCVFYYKLMKKQKSRSSKSRAAKSIPIKRYLWFFAFYSKNPFTKTKILTIHKEVTSMSIFSHVEAIVQTVKIFNVGLILYIVFGVGSFLLFQNTIHAILACLLVLVIVDQYFYKTMQKTTTKLRKEELALLSDLRQEYVRTGSVVEAFESVKPGPYIAKAVHEIHSALSSNDVEEKLMQFASSTPLPTLQTLSSIAYITDNKGDSQTAEGISTFTHALNMISDEVRMAIRKEQHQQNLLGSAEIFALIPILGIPIICKGFTAIIPGVGAIYDGFLGFVFIVITLLASFYCYKTITGVTRSSTVISDDRTATDKKLMSNITIKDFIHKIRPKTYKVVKKKQDLLRSALSRLDLDYLYLRKTYSALIGFFLTILLLIIGVQVGKASVWDSVVAVSLTGSTKLSAEDTHMLQNMDYMFMSAFAEDSPSTEDIEAFVNSEMPYASTSARSEQVSRLSAKYDSYHGLYFRWWFIWVAFVVGLLAYMLPEQGLKMRVKLIESEMEDDCLQLQTSIAILMNTSADTLELLEQLSMNSRVFKPILIDCYLAYTMDAEKALRRAKFSSNLLDFRLMMDKLSLTVTQLTLAEVFSNLNSERDHILRMREASQINTIERLRHKIKKYIYGPGALLVILLFIAPICILAYSMFIDLMGSGLFST